jgi:hypothetical protein
MCNISKHLSLARLFQMKLSKQHSKNLWTLSHKMPTNLIVSREKEMHYLKHCEKKS